MFKLAIGVCFKIYFGSIHAVVLSLESTKSVYFFWDTRYMYQLKKILAVKEQIKKQSDFTKILDLLTSCTSIGDTFIATWNTR